MFVAVSPRLTASDLLQLCGDLGFVRRMLKQLRPPLLLYRDGILVTDGM